MKTTSPRLRHKLIGFVACTLTTIILASGAASAATLMFDLGSRTPAGSDLTNSPLHAANPAFTDTYWESNPPYSPIGAYPVKYSDGSAATGIYAYAGRSSGGTNPVYSTVTFAGNASSFTSTSTANDGVFANANSIGNDGITAQSGRTEAIFVAFALGGLPAGSYDIYIVGRNNASPSPMHFYATEFSLSNTTKPLNDNANNVDLTSLIASPPTGAYATSTNNVTATWTEGGNYVKLSVTLTGAENTFLGIFAIGDNPNGTTSAGRGIINSIQIVSQIPEPVTVATFAGLAIFLTVFFIRRIRHNS